MSALTVYNNASIICFILFMVLLGITIIYGRRVHILELIMKKTGVLKKREIAKMEEGKAVRHRTVRQVKPHQQYTTQIHTQMDEQQAPQTEKLQEEDKIVMPAVAETTVLQSSENARDEDFVILQNIIEVHGKRLEDV